MEFLPEAAPKGAVKNRVHLDVRLSSDEDHDEVAAQVRARGGEAYDPGWGELPWRLHRDPSGNEFCVLDAAGGN